MKFVRSWYGSRLRAIDPARLRATASTPAAIAAARSLHEPVTPLHRHHAHAAARKRTRLHTAGCRARSRAWSRPRA